MTLGIFTKVFARPTLEATLDAVAAHGVRSVQFNLECAGVPDLPDRLDPALCDRIRREMATRGIAMTALSGTYNMAHPDPERRREDLGRFRVLVSACRSLGADLVTLCTGTRDPGYMWRAHPDNGTEPAWRDTVDSMRRAVSLAEEHGVTLAFEPEVANVVDSASRARRLLDEVASPRLKIVMDGANLYHRGELPRMREILSEAFALLGPDIALAHAKDLDRDGEAGHLAAGTGLLDYDHYISLLRVSGYRGSLVLHGLTEAQAPGCLSFLRGKLNP